MAHDAQFEDAQIKVIGVGGGGNNAVDHMIASSVLGVEFVAANTDSQALERSQASVKLPLGRTGLGAGAKPEKGQEAALEKRSEIRAALEGAHMVFITAGMGGGTGTGAAPVVAEVAREMGILTVGVVTKPFAFEGARRNRAAEAGIRELAKNVDSLITVLNDRLLTELGEDVAASDAFAAADDVLKNAVSGIVEVITQPGLLNVDFEDVRTVMTGMGRSMMGAGQASGEDRAERAASMAVSSPLLEGENLSGARGVLVNISAARSSLRMREVNKIMEVIESLASPDAHVIMGAVYNDELGEDLRVTVVAAGLGEDEVVRVAESSHAGRDLPGAVMPGIRPMPIPSEAPPRQRGAGSLQPGHAAQAAPATAVRPPISRTSSAPGPGDAGAFDRPAVWRTRGDAVATDPSFAGGATRPAHTPGSSQATRDIPHFLRHPTSS